MKPGIAASSAIAVRFFDLFWAWKGRPGPRKTLVRAGLPVENYPCWCSRKQLSSAASIDFRHGMDGTNLEQSETSGPSRGHMGARLASYLVRAVASRLSNSSLRLVSPKHVWRPGARTSLRRRLRTILHSCIAKTQDPEKLPHVNPSRGGPVGLISFAYHAQMHIPSTELRDQGTSWQTRSSLHLLSSPS